MVRRIFSFALLLLAGLSAQVDATRFYVDPATGDNRRSHVVVQDSGTPWRTITHALEMAHIITKGRHDPCVGIRGVPVVEAMMALVLADQKLLHRAQCGEQPG